MQEADSSVTPSRRIPFGLYNPSNHCYNNSMLQVILHLIQDNPWDEFNDNKEGDILLNIMKYIAIVLFGTGANKRNTLSLQQLFLVVQFPTARCT